MMVRLRRYWIQITADRRKFGMLCAAFGIGLLLWARLIVVSNMPKTAMADEEKNDPPSSAMPITDRSSSAQDARPIELRLDEQPLHDPFAVSEDHFPSPIRGIHPDDPKSLEPKTEDPMLVERRRQQDLQSLASEFTLDAVMGNSSLAMINGTIYRIGEEIESGSKSQIRFTLTEVKHRAVILEHEGYRFELKMSTPGK